MAVRLLPSGDGALTIEFGSAIDPATSAAVASLDQAVARLAGAGSLPGLIEAVPTFRSLTLLYDPLLTDQASLAAILDPLLRAGPVELPGAGRNWCLPVCYEGDAGPDLEETARAAGLTVAEVVEQHRGTEYRVLMLGFLPGFPFLGEVGESLRLPRRQEPRLRVPAGSVAIAAGLTAIYPWESPGGWHLLGLCAAPLFDPRRPDPALLAVGDQVRFTPVSSAEHVRLRTAAMAGEMGPEYWLARGSRP